MELKLFLRNWSRYKLLKNIDSTKVRFEAARMNNNSFMPPLKHLSYVTSVIVHLKVAIWRWKWGWSFSQNKRTSGDGAGK